MQIGIISMRTNMHNQVGVIDIEIDVTFKVDSEALSFITNLMIRNEGLITEKTIAEALMFNKLKGN